MAKQKSEKPPKASTAATSATPVFSGQSLAAERTQLAVTLPIRQLVEFLLRTGSIDNRFTGFDRANEGSRIHRRLQRQAEKDHPGYAAEVALRQEMIACGIAYTLEGRADGIFTAPDGITVVDEIKTTALPSAEITGEQSPEHWAQGICYAAIYAAQKNLSLMRVQLTYFQIDEETVLRFQRDLTATELNHFVLQLLQQYAPWAQRSAEWNQQSRQSWHALEFPFDTYRPGQKAMMQEVYHACHSGGALLCQAPTGIGKTMSVLFPALKAASQKDAPAGPIFYLTARGTTRAAAENALELLRKSAPALRLRSVTLTAKDKICLCESRECTPEACPYAEGYYSRVKEALWDALDCASLTAQSLTQYAQKHWVCPFELGLDLSLWCDVIVGDYNYLFDPVVSLRRFFETRGPYLFLVDEAHNLPGRARDMHSAHLCKSQFFDAKKALGKTKSALGNALNKVNAAFIRWRHSCEETALEAGTSPSHNGATQFQKQRDEEFDRLLTRLCDPLEQWLDDNRQTSDLHSTLLTLFFDVRTWLRVADTFDEHFVLQLSCHGSEVRATQLCLDPSAFLAQNFALGRAAVLFSATLSPASYYKDLCGLPEARAVALKSPFPRENFGLWCAGQISTRYKDRIASVDAVVGLLAAMAMAKTGNYIAFFPSYSYLEQVYTRFEALWPQVEICRQQPSMQEDEKQDFLARFTPTPKSTLLGFAVLGGVFGEGVDLIGNRLIGVAIVGPGLPQVNPRTEQLRDYFEQTRGNGFDYAYRFPGMNKVLQAAGRVIRTPQDRGVVLLIDGRFVQNEYRRLMPPHWDGFSSVLDEQALQHALSEFWKAE